MAIEDILSAIEAEAEAEASRIIADAQHQAGEILDQARNEVEGEAERFSHARDDEAAAATRRVISRAHLDAARTRRDARETIYHRALDQAAESLKRLRDRTEYRDVLGRLLEEALAVAPDTKTVWVGEADVDLARDLLDAIGSRGEVKPGEVAWGGVVLTADGQTVYNDLSSRLERADDHLRYIAADIFPELRGVEP